MTTERIIKKIEAHGFPVEVLPENKIKVVGAATALSGDVLLDEVLQVSENFSLSGSLVVNGTNEPWPGSYEYKTVYDYLGYDDVD